MDTPHRGISQSISEQELELIHDRVIPADVRPSDRILARIRPRVDGKSDYRDVRVWAISPLGIEVRSELLNSELFQVGSPVDLELVVQGKRTLFTGLVCTSKRTESELELGVRYSSAGNESQSDEERRTSSRWLCSEDFVPVAHCPSPGRFNDVIHFKLRDVSAAGLQLTTSLRNKFLIPGMELYLSIVFPLGPIVQLKTKIVRTSVTQIGSKDRLVVGVKFSKISPLARNALGQYLIQFSNVDSLLELSEMGFEPKSVASSCSIYYLKSEQDYLDALNLRYQANKDAGHLGTITQASETADILDAKSRILVAKRNEEIIGTGRFRFPLFDEKLEFEEFIQMPSNFPRRDQIIEASRLATDVRFRKSDLLAGMMKFVVTTIVSDERPWVIATVMKKYVPFYKKIGFTDTDLRFDNPKWSEPQHVLIGDAISAILGKNVHPLYWNFVWSDVANFWIESGMVSPTRLDKIRIWILRRISFFSRIFLSSNPRAVRKTA